MLIEQEHRQFVEGAGELPDAEGCVVMRGGAMDGRHDGQAKRAAQVGDQSLFVKVGLFQHGELSFSETDVQQVPCNFVH